MGLEDGANRKRELAASGEDGGSFWKSLPGILTGMTGLIAAITGLVVGLNQAGLIGDDRRPPANQSVPLLGSERNYRVGQVSDGFAWVRREPTVANNEIERLPTGMVVTCSSRTVVDKDGAADRAWRYCAAHKGYVSARLLVLVDR